MATNSNLVPSTSSRGKNREEIYNLYESTDINDWTRVIHHDLAIKRRTCKAFIPKSSGTSNPAENPADILCGCKRRRREHSWDVFDGTDREWDRKKHTTVAFNNAFGYLPKTRAHYTRCDVETDPNVLAKLLLGIWRKPTKPKPQLIMCVIGGAKYFKLSERLEREFIKGLIRAALRAEGWIVTTGFRTGVVQLVGDAIHDHKVTNPGSEIVAIGCSKWGAVRNRESLKTSKESKNIDLNASMGAAAKREKGEQDLEPNHTHFLFLDDGTYYGYEVGDYRTRLVKSLAAYDDGKIPIVTIVVEGGPDTLSTIYLDLCNDIPVVLIDGSGRVPNLLSNFLNRTEAMVNQNKKNNDNVNWKEVIDIETPTGISTLRNKFTPYDDEIRDGLKNISKGLKTSEKELEDLYNRFIYCLQPAVRANIRIYNLDSDRTLDDVIFEAIIEAKQQTQPNREQLLNLALSWDAIQVAKERIIKDDLSDLSATAKESVFFKALLLDRPQFVNKFIKINFQIHKMFYKSKNNRTWQLEWNQLRKLYDDQSKKKDRLYLLDDYRKNKSIGNENDLDELLKSIIGDYCSSIYSHSPSSFVRCLQFCCKCCNAGRVSDSHVVLTRDDDDNDQDEYELLSSEEAELEIREHTLRDLFLWAILTNRIEMAKVFISHMQNRVCAALIASKILKKYIDFAADNESKDTLHNQAEEFEGYASEFLKCCHNYDEARACEIAIRKIHAFGGVTCLQVAVAANNKNFVGQPCCDQLLSYIWYDKMELSRINQFERVGLLLSIITFGLLAPFFLTFREEKPIPISFDKSRKKQYEITLNEETRNKPTSPTEATRSVFRLKSYGINYSDIYRKESKMWYAPVRNYFHLVKKFHEAPFIKFSYNVASYIFFLLLYSYFLLFDFKIPTNGTPSIHWTEILVIVIITTMLIQDIRDFICQDNHSTRGKLWNYFIHNSLASIMRITCYVLFYIGLILRFTHASTDEELSAAKIILAYDLELWFFRSLGFITVVRKMGPKLVMIKKMLVDLMFFTYIILTAMVGYGVASRAMYNYNGIGSYGNLTFDGRSIFRSIVYPVYYFMYGSFDGERSALDTNPDMSTSIATQVLLAFHMLFVNILLINILIAMFTHTFDSIQEKSDLVWRYDRYSLVRDYFDRPPLFPPLSILAHIWELIHAILRSCRAKRLLVFYHQRAKIFKMIGANRQIDKEWSEFENYATNLHARSLISGEPSTVHQEVPETSLSPDVKEISDELVSVKRAIGDLRTYAEEMNRCMQWMMDAMERVKMSKTPKPKLRSPLTTNDIALADE